LFAYCVLVYLGVNGFYLPISGDTDFKTYISGVPDVLEIDLEMIESEFLVLASDGLWDVCSAEEVRDSIDKMIVGSGKFISE